MTVLAFRKKSTQKIHLPLAPLVDILANLAFFFMIHASFGASADQTKVLTSSQPSHLIESLVIEVEEEKVFFDHQLLLQSKESHPFSAEQKSKLRHTCETYFESAQALSQKRWVQEAWVDVVVSPGVAYSRVEAVTTALKEAGFAELRYRVQHSAKP